MEQVNGRPGYRMGSSTNEYKHSVEHGRALDVSLSRIRCNGTYRCQIRVLQTYRKCSLAALWLQYSS